MDECLFMDHLLESRCQCILHALLYLIKRIALDGKYVDLWWIERINIFEIIGQIICKKITRTSRIDKDIWEKKNSYLKITKEKDLKIRRRRRGRKRKNTKNCY